MHDGGERTCVPLLRAASAGGGFAGRCYGDPLTSLSRFMDRVALHREAIGNPDAEMQDVASAVTVRWRVRALLAVDGLLLFSLLVLCAVWWLVKAEWTFLGQTYTLVWRDWLIAVPLGLGLLHGWLVLGPSSGIQIRGGLFRFRGVQRLVLVYVALAVLLPSTESMLHHMKVDVWVAPLLLASRQNGIVKYHEDLIRDPELLWRFQPGSFVYGARINSLGFRERDVEPRKSPGVKRVICLGDSVTAQGIPGYAHYLHDLLTNAPPDGGRWEAFGMGVYGYSSQQGLRLFELQGRSLHPDVVTVSFGRNDHNLAMTTDRVRMACRMPACARLTYEFFANRRIGRLILHLVDNRHRWTAVANADAVRVPPADFRDNLHTLVAEIRSAGAIPILITAPRRKIPESYAILGYAHSAIDFERQHDEYAQIVREVAWNTGATLVDMEVLMAGPECDGYFAADAVHFDFYDSEADEPSGGRDQPGLRRFATELYRGIQSTVTNGRPDCVVAARNS